MTGKAQVPDGLIAPGLLAAEAYVLDAWKVIGRLVVTAWEFDVVKGFE